MSVSASVRAVAFDFAGTLTTRQRRRPDGALVRRILAGLGTETAEDFAASFDASMWRYYVESLPDSLARLLRDTAAHHGVRLPHMDVLIREIWLTCGDHPIDPAAADAVRAQHEAGRITVLASNTCRNGEYRRATLAAAGLDFMRVVCSADIGVAKPYPGFYQRVIEEADATPGQIVFVGDSLENDVVGASNAGMRAVLVDPGRPPTAAPARLVDGTIVISHTAQLAEAIQ